MNWQNLNDNEKLIYEEYCTKKYGKYLALSESGEPLYFDNKLNLINTKIIINLLFNKSLN